MKSGWRSSLLCAKRDAGLCILHLNACIKTVAECTRLCQIMSVSKSFRSRAYGTAFHESVPRNHFQQVLNAFVLLHSRDIKRRYDTHAFRTLKELICVYRYFLFRGRASRVAVVHLWEDLNPFWRLAAVSGNIVQREQSSSHFVYEKKPFFCRS